MNDSPPTTTPPRTLVELQRRTLVGKLGEDPALLHVSVGFVISQGARHIGRSRYYRNELLSLRVGAAVGSCGVEPGALAAAGDLLDERIGAPVDALLTHPVGAVRVAALDAYLMHTHPHPGPSGATVRIPGGSSLTKSQARARAVVDLLAVGPGATVLVIGVVNSLLAELRVRGVRYLPCGGTSPPGPPRRARADCRSRTGARRR